MKNFFKPEDFRAIYSKIMRDGYKSHGAGDMWEPDCRPDDIAKIANEKLDPVLKELVEALAWYSDRNNWMRSYVFDTERLVPSAWADKLKSQDCAMLNCGGGRARLALQKYKQMMGD